MMSFDLTNALVTFQSYINKALFSYLDIFALTYLNDILIYSTEESEHEAQVIVVLIQLRKYELHIKLEKCEFSVRKIMYLSFLVSETRVFMNLFRVKTIIN